MTFDIALKLAKWGELFHRTRLRSLRVAIASSTIAAGVLVASQTASAQAAPPMDHSKMGHAMTVPDPLGVPMNRAGSGTTWIPDAVLLPTQNFMAGNWHLMVHGFAFAQYNKQSGDRGDSQFGSLNWGMFMASRGVKGGRLQLRSMLSIDAATVGPRGYPLLGQSGELYNGQPIADRQHPHDFFMELGVSYEKPIAPDFGITLYVAPSGEPALGPVAFMHRPSSMDLPTAPLSHHWQDATHVAFGVMSAGFFTNFAKVEFSAFNGREPNQHRWDFDRINIDSYSGRLTVNPNKNLSFTAGYGFLKSPEALHPDESKRRFVASAIHGTTIGKEGQWSTTFVYGRNDHDEQEPAHGGVQSAMLRDVAMDVDEPASHSFLLESEIITNRKNTFFGRAEYVRKTGDELMLITSPTIPPPGEQNVEVRTLSLGYVRELATLRGATLGLGGMGTLNSFSGGANRWYGSGNPWGGVVFLRVRPAFKRAEPEPAMNHSQHKL